MRLTKQRRNELFRAVEAGGLDPRELELSEPPAGPVELVHEASGATLKLREERTLAGSEEFGYRLALFLNGRGPRRWTIEANLPRQPKGRNVTHSWPEVVERVGNWARRMAEDLSEPDLWNSIGSASRMSDRLDDEDNSAFTEEEQRVIAESLGTLKLEARDTYELSDEQAVRVEAKLDYLIEASKRVGRLDWRNLVAGTMLGVLTEAIMPRQTTLKIFSHLLNSVAHLLGHPLPQLGA